MIIFVSSETLMLFSHIAAVIRQPRGYASRSRSSDFSIALGGTVGNCCLRMSTASPNFVAEHVVSLTQRLGGAADKVWLADLLSQV